MNYFWPGSVNIHWGPGLVNINWGPGPVNTNAVPGPVNTNLGPGPVNTNWGPGPRLGAKAGGWEIQIPGNYSHHQFSNFPLHVII